MATSDTDVCNIALSYAGVRTRINQLTESSIPAQQCNVLYAQYRDALLTEYNWPFAVRRAILVPYASSLIWSATTTYGLGDKVRYGANVYQSLQAANLNKQPNLNVTLSQPNNPGAAWLQLTRDDFGYACPLPNDVLRVEEVYAQPTVSAAQVPNAVTPPAPSRNPTSDARSPFRIEDADDGTGLQVFLTDISTPVIKYVAQITNPRSFSPQFVSALAWRLAPDLSRALRADPDAANKLEAKAKLMINEAVAVAMRSEQGDPEPASEFELSRESSTSSVTDPRWPRWQE